MIDDKHLNEVCKMGQGADCCAYLMVHPETGISCAKNTEFYDLIKKRVDRMVARADNCPGYGVEEETHD